MKSREKKIVFDFSIVIIIHFSLIIAIDRFEPPTLLKKKPKTKIGFLIGHGEVLAYEDNKVTLTNKSEYHS